MGKYADVWGKIFASVLCINSCSGVSNVDTVTRGMYRSVFSNFDIIVPQPSDFITFLVTQFLLCLRLNV